MRRTHYLCTQPDCLAPHKARGLCERHYQSLYHHRNPEPRGRGIGGSQPSFLADAVVGDRFAQARRSGLSARETAVLCGVSCRTVQRWRALVRAV